MKVIFDLDIDKCSACGACAIACMDQNDIDVELLESPFRVVSDVETNEKINFVSIACFHCDDAPCISACPCGCLSKDEESGLTLYNTELCIGCHSCAMACPFGAPSFSKEGKMQKCDGCIVRLKNGMEPACVRTCPTKALTCTTEDEYKEDHIKRSIKKIASYF